MGDEATGAQIVRRAVEEPLKQIAVNAGLEGGVDLGSLLADAGEDDAAARDAGGAGAQQFALADHVGPGAFARKQPQNGEVAVRLHRVVHLRVQPGVGERGGKGPVARAHRGGGVDPGGGADLVGDAVQRHVVEDQPVHGVHGQPRASGDLLGDGGVGAIKCCGGVGGHSGGHTPGQRIPRPYRDAADDGGEARRLQTVERG